MSGRLVSRAVSASYIQAILNEVVPGMVVIARASWGTLPAQAIGAAVLCEEDHPEWPRRLFFPMLPVDHTLGAQPHLVMAEYIAERLGTATLTRLSGSDDSDSLAMRAEGEWWRAQFVDNPKTGKLDVVIVDTPPPGQRTL